MDHWLALIQETTTIPASQQAGSAVGETLDTWIGIVQKLLTTLAILVGAFIALVKFQLLNPLTRRLEPEITSGSVGVHKGKVYLHAQATVRNTELLPVTIGPDYTGLRLWVFRNETHDWERVET